MDNTIFQKIKNRFQQVEQDLQSPDIVGDPTQLQKVSLEYNELKEQVEGITTFESLQAAVTEAQDIIDANEDPEFVELAQEEIGGLQDNLKKAESALQVLLLPKDPNDKKDVVVEIRAGAGGDEAALFAAELFRAYGRYCEEKGWKTEIVSQNHIGIGGFKEVVFEVHGAGAHGDFKYESGVHRVQRVPETEKQGRVHTSTITVAVMPVIETVEMHIPDSDLRVDVFRSSGPGGQSVNTTDSAVRVTHIPSGLIVTSQDGKSQHKNREKALTVMRSRLHQMKEEQQRQEQGDARRSQIGTGDRSEKIRTYNFPQDRITDHRIKHNWNNIEARMSGDLGALIESLRTAEQEKQLEELG
jgi:peptide chain release factor 1